MARVYLAFPSLVRGARSVDPLCTYVSVGRRGNITSYSSSLLKFDGRYDEGFSMKTLRRLIEPRAPSSTGRLVQRSSL